MKLQISNSIISNEEIIRPTKVEVNLDQLKLNFSAIKKHIGDTMIMPILKANAYGHGLVEIARFYEKLQVEYIGVAFLEEAVLLRNEGIVKPILVLGGIIGNQIPYFLKHNITITSALTVFSFSSFAQQKIGHVNIEEIIGLMPETQEANTKMQGFQTELQKDMKFLEEEYTKLMSEIEAGQANGWSQLMLQSKQEDLYNAQQKIYAFQQDAQQKLVNKEVELMNPIVEKLQNAVNAIAKEKGYSYILDASQSKGVVIFKEDGKDLGPLVKAKLGIQ